MEQLHYNLAKTKSKNKKLAYLAHGHVMAGSGTASMGAVAPGRGRRAGAGEVHRGGGEAPGRGRVAGAGENRRGGGDAAGRGKVAGRGKGRGGVRGGATREGRREVRGGR